MLGIILVFIACFFWASDGIIRYPLLKGGVEAKTIVLYEHLILTTIFVPILFKSRKKYWKGELSHFFYFLIVGGIGSALATLAFTNAFTLINPTIVILLQKLQPVFAIFLANIVLKEKLSRPFFIWGGISLIGALLVTFPSFNIEGLKDFSFTSQKELYGLAFTLIAVVGWGSATVFGKKLSLERYEAKEIMAGRFFCGLITLFIFSTYKSIPLHLTIDSIYQILFLAIISGFVAMLFYYKGLEKIKAKTCTLIEMSFPFCAVLANWIFLGMTLNTTQLIGGVLLVLGATVVQVKSY